MIPLSSISCKGSPLSNFRIRTVLSPLYTFRGNFSIAILCKLTSILLFYLNFISFLEYIYSSLSIGGTYLRYNLPIILNGFNKARNLILTKFHIANFYLKVHVRLNIQI